MSKLGHTAFLLSCAILVSSFASPPSVRSAERSPNQQRISGPVQTMNEALAAGATATITLQPVAPKTVPASSYPAGTTINGTTISLGSVPARVWIEMHVTGWAPDQLVTTQVRIDGTDVDGDGGGYYGANAECAGVPVIGAGDITPALQPCSGTCSTDGRNCTSASECRFCEGGSNAGLPCTITSNCPGGFCPSSAGITCTGATQVCRNTMSGLTSNCNIAEPSTCTLGPVGNRYCQWAFIDGCDPDFLASGLSATMAVDTATPNPRCGVTMNSEPDYAIDHAPSYLATVVLDVPADAKGDYVIDINQTETFMMNRNAHPNNVIPIAALNAAVIRVGSCETNVDCNDNDVCTTDSCQGVCCTNTPVPSWDQATECCHPTTGTRTAKPQSTGCREGVCSLGGSSGVPTFASRPDGTPCSDDPCYEEGQCSAGQCVAQQYAGPDCPKPRFISFDIATGGTPAAYRVRMVSLHHPDPPYAIGAVSDFSAFEGQYRWVGPPDTYVESSANQTPVYAAFTTCDPHYQDWSPIDLLHVSGAEIVPSSVYEVQSIAEGLDVNVESNYSSPMTIATARWSDVSIPFAPPATTTQPDQSDNTALVVKFRSQQGAMSKPRALLAGAAPSGIPSLELDVSFTEIAAVIDAFRGFPYPYAGPVPCP
jgi:hypothetical protein